MEVGAGIDATVSFSEGNPASLLSQALIPIQKIVPQTMLLKPL
jgi:hypothetical protein